MLLVNVDSPEDMPLASSSNKNLRLSNEAETLTERGSPWDFPITVRRMDELLSLYMYNVRHCG